MSDDKIWGYTGLSIGVLLFVIGCVLYFAVYKKKTDTQPEKNGWAMIVGPLLIAAGIGVALAGGAIGFY